jgi:hypothetical protein
LDCIQLYRNPTQDRRENTITQREVMESDRKLITPLNVCSGKTYEAYGFMYLLYELHRELSVYFIHSF